MKKLMLLFLFCCTFTMLNAQQQRNHVVNLGKETSDSIYVLKSDTTYTTFKTPLQFNSFIQVRVHELSQLFQRASKEKKHITLFLDGIEMKGIVPIGKDKSKEVLFFVLHRDSISMKQWQLVRRILLLSRNKELLVSVGLNGEEPYPSTVRLQAELSRSGDYYLAFLSYTLAIILFAFLLKRTNALRIRRQSNTDFYSLSKTLIAFWTFLILFSTLFLLAAINTFPHITMSVIILIVIPVVSALIAMALDFSKNDPKSRRTGSSGMDFLKDIVSDSKGISIFRLQLILFTLLTGSYFIFSVVNEMLLPVFDSYFLVLFGISHLIYLSFKWFENKKRL